MIINAVCKRKVTKDDISLAIITQNREQILCRFNLSLYVTSLKKKIEEATSFETKAWSTIGLCTNHNSVCFPPTDIEIQESKIEFET